MIVSGLDIFYILMIAAIFGFIIHLEAQMSVVKTMLQEMVKCEDKLKELSNNDKTH